MQPLDLFATCSRRNERRDASEQDLLASALAASWIDIGKNPIVGAIWALLGTLTLILALISVSQQAAATEIYAINAEEDMLLYEHFGYRDGSANWWPGSGTKIGNGWNFKQVFAGSDGAIYAITFDGDMLFYRLLGFQDGRANWQPGGGTKIGNGWNFKQVFAGPEGAIYAITDAGDMLFYKHLGYRDGSANWWSGSGTKIGNGWNFKQVFAGPEGAIYAITDTGDMLFYRHFGYRDGSANWWPGGGIKIGNGWNFVHLMANQSVEAWPSAQTGAQPHSQTRQAGSSVLERRFDRPTYENGPARLDVCDHFGNFCGQPAADDYCRIMGYERASKFETEHATPTRVINFGQECRGAGCAAFRFIVCSTRARAPGRMSGWPHKLDPN